MSYERAGAWTVDRAMRALATACAGQRRPVPGAGAVLLDPEGVALRLTTPDPAAPPGWTADASGRTWRAALHAVERAPLDDRLPDPYPLLVSLGVAEGGRLLLNLAEARGFVGLEGDPGLAGRLVRSWARRLTASPWASDVRVVRVGFEPDPEMTGVSVARLADAGAALSRPRHSTVLLFAAPPSRQDRYHAERLLAQHGRRWAAVAVGAELPAWRFTIRMDGAVDTGLLAAPVRLRSS